MFDIQKMAKEIMDQPSKNVRYNPNDTTRSDHTHVLAILMGAKMICDTIQHCAASPDIKVDMTPFAVGATTDEPVRCPDCNGTDMNVDVDYRNLENIETLGQSGEMQVVCCNSRCTYRSPWTTYDPHTTDIEAVVKRLLTF